MEYIKPGIGLLGAAILGLGLFFVFEVYIAADEGDSFTNQVISKEAPLSALPVQLQIPSIKIDAFVQTVGLAEDSVGEMAVPDNFTDVGWYKYGPRPGMPGSAVMAGHLNGKNVPEAVFYNLGEVEIGDHVMVIGEDGTVLTFTVVDVRIYAHDADTEEVFVSNDGVVRLNLITCAGDWLSNEDLYEERTVIFTELLSETE